MYFDVDPCLPVPIFQRNLFKECICLYLLDPWWQHYNKAGDKEIEAGSVPGTFFKGLTVRKFKAVFGVAIVYETKTLKNVHGPNISHPTTGKTIVTVWGDAFVRHLFDADEKARASSGGATWCVALGL